MEKPELWTADLWTPAFSTQRIKWTQVDNRLVAKSLKKATGFRVRGICGKISGASLDLRSEASSSKCLITHRY